MNTFQALQQLSDELALGLDITTYESLSLRSTGSCRIAIMGLVSRGKSTLVNQLVGLDLLPVSHRGETASDVHIESGSEATQLLFDDGSIDDRLLSLERFSQAILRSSTPKVLEARISIPCRMPTGVVLVDTPGIDDAVSQTERFDYLNNHWKRSGASGAIVVVSVPPGLGRSDRHLVATAHELFGNSLAVIIKPTDSTVTDSDLREVATQVHHHIEVAPVVLPDVRNPKNWGEGPLAPVERAIMHLVSRSEQSRADASMRIADVHATIMTAIRGTSGGHLERLKRLSQLSQVLPTDLASAVNEQVALLEAEYERQQKLKQESERSAHLALLDAQAAEFIKVLKGVRPHSQPKKVFSDALLELIPIAKAGSQSARDVLRSWCGAMAVSERGRLGIQLLANRRHDDLEFLVDVLENATLDSKETEFLIKKGSLALLGATKTRKLISCSLLRFNVDELAKLVTLTQRLGGEIEQDCRERFVSKLQQEVFGTIGQVRLGSGIGGLLKLRQNHESYVSRLESLQSQINIVDLVEIAKEIQKKFEQDIIYVAVAMAKATVDSMFIRRHAEAGPSIAQEVKELRDHVQWFNSIIPSTETEGLVRMCGEDGALMRMDRAVEDAISASVKQAESAKRAIQITYFSSYFAWVISICILFFADFTAAFILWLASFVLWLVTRSQQDQPKTWKDFYRQPSIQDDPQSRPPGPSDGLGAKLKAIKRLSQAVWLSLLILGVFNLCLTALVSITDRPWDQSSSEVRFLNSVKFVDFSYLWSRYVETMFSSRDWNGRDYDSSEEIWWVLAAVLVCLIARNRYRRLSRNLQEDTSQSRKGAPRRRVLVGQYGDTEDWVRQTGRHQNQSPKYQANPYRKTASGESGNSSDMTNVNTVGLYESHTPIAAPRLSDSKEEGFRKSFAGHLSEALKDRRFELVIVAASAVKSKIETGVNRMPDVGSSVRLWIVVPQLQDQESVEVARGMGFKIIADSDGFHATNENFLITRDLAGISRVVDHLVDVVAAIYGGFDWLQSVYVNNHGETTPEMGFGPDSSVMEPQEIESEDLRNSDFFGCDLSGWSFHRCDLRGVRFDGAVLTAGRITQCNVQGASFRGAQLQGVRFHGRWSQSGVGKTIAGSEMANCDFEEADLTGAFLGGVNLRGASFRNAILNGVDFRGINSAVPTGFEPKDADLSGATLDGAKSDSSTIWPLGFSAGSTTAGDVPLNSQPVERGKMPVKFVEPSSDEVRSQLQGQLNVSIENLVEGTCTLIDVGAEGTLIFRVSDSFDKALKSAIERVASKVDSVVARLTWASRKGMDGLWEPIMIAGFRDPTHNQPMVVLGVVRISDYRTSDRTRSIIAQLLSILAVDNRNFYVLPPVLLWDGTFSAAGGRVGLKFRGTIVSSKAMRPIHLDAEGWRTGRENAQTKSMSLEAPGAIRLSRFLPNFFLQESVGGELGS